MKTVKVAPQSMANITINKSVKLRIWKDKTTRQDLNLGDQKS